MKKLLLDFILLGEVCNFRCPYCTSRKQAVGFDSGFMETLRRNLDGALQSVRDVFLIYRFGGGELFLAEPVVTSLLERRFPLTQFLTNGTLLSDGLLDRFAEAKERIAICMSLDGHTPEMNRMRESAKGMRESTLREILNNLSRILGAGVPVEIQMVLSEANGDALPSTLTYFLDHYPTENLLVSIFPVRPLPRGVGTSALETILSDYPLYREILPSRDYMEGLLHAVSRPRRERCRVPDHVTFMVLHRAWKANAERCSYFCECGGLRHFYGGICSSCYTHYDLYNSILSGRTALDTIPFPIFRRKEIQEYLSRHAKPERPRRLSDLLAYAKAKLLGNHF